MYLKNLLTAIGFLLPIFTWGQNCSIQSTATKICKESSTILSVVKPKIDSMNQILKKFQTSGLVKWNYRFSPVITGRANTYGLPGMLVFGDSTTQIGFIEAEIRATEVGPNASAGIAMAVNQNSFKDGHPYNGPGSYYLALRDGGELILYNGTGNTPSGYFPAVVESVKIPDLNFRNNNKVKLEILPGGIIQGSVNENVWINYQIPNGIIPIGKFSLIAANSSIECKQLNASKRTGGIYWSTGETTSSIIISPYQTTTYKVNIMEDNKTCTKEIKIEVNKSFVVLNDTIMDGETYNFNGQNLTSSGTYTSILENSVGCDSVVSLSLFVKPKQEPLECKINLLQDTICLGSSANLSAEILNPLDTDGISSFLEKNPNFQYLLSFRNKNYFAFNSKMSWLEAKSLGDSLNLNLFVINDSIEEKLIYNSLPFTGEIQGYNPYWIGLFQDKNDPNYIEPGKGWKWVDGSEYIYQNWGFGEPNNNFGGSQDCATINFWGIKWDDDDCDKNHFSVFETVYPKYKWSTGSENRTITVTPDEKSTYSVSITDEFGLVCSTDITLEVSQIISPIISGIEEFTDINQSPIKLVGTPAGGKFSGKGIVDSIFNPKLAGLGKVSIDYSYANDFGCFGNATKSTIVFDTTGTFCISSDTIVTNLAIYDTLYIKIPDSKQNSFTNQKSLKVYPNPAKYILTIDYEDYELMNDFRINILNPLGQLIYSAPLNQKINTIDLSTFKRNGIYFLQLIDPQNKILENKKIVIQQ